MSCSAIGCRNRPADKLKDVSYHRFPDNEEIKNRWVIAMRRTPWVPLPSSRLCSQHFLPEDFDPTSPFRKRLKANAIPSVFIYSEKPVKERRASIRPSPQPHPIEQINITPFLQIFIKEEVEECSSLQNESRLTEEICRQELEEKDQEITSMKQTLPQKSEAFEKLNQMIQRKNNVILRQKKKLKRLRDTNEYLKRRVFTLKNLLRNLKKEISC